MPVIKIENLWKEYRLGVIGHGTLTHDLQSWWAKVRGKEDPNSKITPMLAGQEKQIEGDRFWALRDINLEVKQGEILGIIGKNGAGKSTLLKILSRVTAPTKGNVKVKGRIASLLEVGTGFHPELTGRENIFMNGAILGMSKQEIKAKLNEIVDFSGVEDFIDTPVKRYSSGMHVRLAFAIAAHLDPEILIIDEVLAVGDAEFQKKCLGKMQDVSKTGRTILFVSHHMAAIEKLCSRCLVTAYGTTSFDGDVKEAISFYLRSAERIFNSRVLPENIKRTGNKEIVFTGCAVEDEKGNQLEAVASGKSVILAFDYKINSNKPSLKNVCLGFSIHGSLGETLSILYSDFSGVTFSDIPKKGTFRCRIEDFPFSEGKYMVGARLMVGRIEADWPHEPIGSINVQAGDFYGTGNVPHSGVGPVLLRGSWENLA
ncbi:ABC transporter ATP-binding protein [Candidatus Electrothrix sp.]|uniref:ABC transporter ATP-binding protein n=1 Tax=Candidatus Electrothrix sp. TaxID=2170559 RepID=UPI004056FBE7